MDRYFVVVRARSDNAMRALSRYGYDLFASTARRDAKAVEFSLQIDGLLSNEEIETLRTDGYQVDVTQSMTEFSAVPERNLEFDDWLKKMEPLTGADSKVE